MIGSRRGFTLIEMMVAVILVTAVGAVTWALLTQNQRVSRAQVAHAGLQDNVRAGALIVANELREIGYDSIPVSAGLSASGSISPDLLVMLPGRLEYKAMRGTGFICALAGPSELRVRREQILGLRRPQVGDSLTAFVESDPATSLDDAWVHAIITAMSTGNCSDGAPADVLQVMYAGAEGTAAPGKMSIGGPVRYFEIMELRYYRSGSRSWLGTRSISAGGVIEPMLGPLADSTSGVRGLTFTYLDRDGNQTTVPNDVRQISWTLLGVTDNMVRNAGSSSLTIDSLALSASIALRNTFR